MNNTLFLDACKGLSTSRPPVWLMRQAGRYMASYRRLREHHGLLDMVKNPELACEVTMQPIHAFKMDAAIIFADILTLLEPMGLHLEFQAGEGPFFQNPVRTLQDIENLQPVSPQEQMGFTLKAIALTRQELSPLGIPLIGFSGAPFTLASYAIEGSGSKHYRLTKQLMYQEPEHWHVLMRKLSQAIKDYLLSQVSAGAQAVQLFDSWVGALSPHDFSSYVAPHLKWIIKEVKAHTQVPVIYFGTGTSGFLDTIALLGADVVGVDWRIDLAKAWKEIGTHHAVQGNLDPLTLDAPWPILREQIDTVLASATKAVKNRQGFIFNLGHGILPQTPEDNVKQLVEHIAMQPN